MAWAIDMAIPFTLIGSVLVLMVVVLRDVVMYPDDAWLKIGRNRMVWILLLIGIFGISVWIYLLVVRPQLRQVETDPERGLRTLSDQ
jgi:hypothetical protein